MSPVGNVLRHDKDGYPWVIPIGGGQRAVKLIEDSHGNLPSYPIGSDVWYEVDPELSSVHVDVSTYHRRPALDELYDAAHPSFTVNCVLYDTKIRTALVVGSFDEKKRFRVEMPAESFDTSSVIQEMRRGVIEKTDRDRLSGKDYVLLKGDVAVIAEALGIEVEDISQGEYKVENGYNPSLLYFIASDPRNNARGELEELIEQNFRE